LPAIGVAGVWAVITLLNGVGEETGWRGYAIPHLQRSHSPLVASLILAAFWATWHVPAFFLLETYQGLGPATVPAFFVGLASGAILLTWLYNRSGGSILLVVLWHGTYNLVSGTEAVQGTIAAAVSTAVIVQAAVLVVLELRVQRGGRPSVLGPPQSCAPTPNAVPLAPAGKASFHKGGMMRD
jgi:membrane protease YdiL (CAAX protease family)